MSGQPPIERPWDAPKEQPKKPMSSKAKLGVAAIIAAVALVSVVWALRDNSSGGSSSTSANNSTKSETSMSLSEAFCSDLKAGLTPMNILGGSVKDGTYTPQEAADRAYGWAAISCPEELRTNEMLRTYLENWNINPDA